VKRSSQTVLVFALAACGGNVVVDPMGGSASSGAGASGTGGFRVAAGGAGTGDTGLGGANVGVVSSTDVGTTTVSVAVSVGSGPPPPCLPCSALFFQGADPSTICPGPEVTLMKTMEACVCQSGCAAMCTDLCQANGPVSGPCRLCTLNSAGGGCFMQVHACSNG
jgi:hypothetical protein